MKLLIADNNTKWTESLKEMFEGFFDEILVCRSGKTAVKFFGSYEPDLVLMNVKLDEMNGLISTRQILSQYRHARILILSNYLDKDIYTAAINAGAIDVIEKQNLFALKENIGKYLS